MMNKYIKSLLSFRYLSNFTIISAFIAYYTNAYTFFFTTIPILIANLIIIVLIQWYNSDELLNGIFNNSNVDPKSIKFEFIVINTIWHIIPLYWVYSVLQHDNIIKIFKPNFMAIFFQSLVIVIPYYYYIIQLQIYGKINYLCYGAVYLFSLLIATIILFT